MATTTPTATQQAQSRVEYHPRLAIAQDPLKASGSQIKYIQAPARTGPASKRWHKAKIILAAFSILFDVIAIGNTASRIDSHNPRFGYLAAICVGPPAVVSIIWAIADFLTIWARGGGRGIHPGAHIGVQLVLFLGFSVAIAFLILLDIQDTYDYHASYYRYDYSAYENGHTMYDAAIALTALLMLVHFVLFIGACVETAKRNTARPVFIISNDAAAYLPPQMLLVNPQNAPPGPSAGPQQSQAPTSATP